MEGIDSLRSYAAKPDGEDTLRILSKCTHRAIVMQKSRLSRRSVGQFNPRAWLDEGDGLVASAKATRELWQITCQEFSEKVREENTYDRDKALHWNRVTGLPRASMLLLGYSVEMYLKAGLAKAYYGCSEEMFSRDVKVRFGHRLVLLAHEIAFALELEDEPKLNLLKDMVLVDARYPIHVDEVVSYSEAVNEQTRRVWSEDNFNSFLELADRVRKHSMKIDNDSKNPASYKSWNIDDDGYLAFRIGGHLPPRITYRVSTVQEQNSAASLSDVKSLFASIPIRALGVPTLNEYWDQTLIFEDGKKPDGRGKTFVRSTPSE